MNGVKQTPGDSFVVINNQLLLATPIPPGTVVVATLGEDNALADDYVSTAQFQALVARITALENA